MDNFDWENLKKNNSFKKHWENENWERENDATIKYSN